MTGEMSTEKSSNNDHRLRYQLLADATIAASKGVSSDNIVKASLDNAIEALCLVTASVRVVDDSGKLVFMHIGGRNEFTEMMRQIEEKMLTLLRDDFAVNSTFLTFQQDGTFSLFSYPIRMGEKTVGTISGITTGERSLALEEDFIRAISAVLALVLNRGKSDPGELQDIMKARSEAVVETAVTINHEVNNPLTAVLGNIQLLLLNSREFSPETLAKLKAVEQSALKIKDVTQNLMKIIEPSVIEYTTGLKMIDLEKSRKQEDIPDEGKEKDSE